MGSQRDAGSADRSRMVSAPVFVGVVVLLVVLIKVVPWLAMSLAALLACALTVKTYRRTRALGGHAERTLATIVAQEETVAASGLSSDPVIVPGAAMSAPVACFTTREGRAVTTRATMSASRTIYPLGCVVPIRYDRDDPTQGEIDTAWGRWGGTIVIDVVAVMLVGGAVALDWLRLRGAV